jgi:hypothetical protein
MTDHNHGQIRMSQMITPNLMNCSQSYIPLQMTQQESQRMSTGFNQTMLELLARNVAQLDNRISNLVGGVPDGSSIVMTNQSSPLGSVGVVQSNQSSLRNHMTDLLIGSPDQQQQQQQQQQQEFQTVENENAQLEVVRTFMVKNVRPALVLLYQRAYEFFCEFKKQLDELEPELCKHYDYNFARDNEGQVTLPGIGNQLRGFTKKYESASPMVLIAKDLVKDFLRTVNPDITAKLETMGQLFAREMDVGGRAVYLIDKLVITDQVQQPNSCQ